VPNILLLATALSQRDRYWKCANGSNL